MYSVNSLLPNEDNLNKSIEALLEDEIENSIKNNTGGYTIFDDSDEEEDSSEIILDEYIDIDDNDKAMFMDDNFKMYKNSTKALNKAIRKLNKKTDDLMSFSKKK